MAEMASVGIREFRANLHKYTAQRDAPITVTSHGEPIGYYIPVRPSPQEKDFDSLKKAARQIADMSGQSGVSEDKIIADCQAVRNLQKHPWHPPAAAAAQARRRLYCASSPPHPAVRWASGLGGRAARRPPGISNCLVDQETLVRGA